MLPSKCLEASARVPSSHNCTLQEVLVHCKLVKHASGHMITCSQLCDEKYSLDDIYNIRNLLFECRDLDETAHVVGRYLVSPFFVNCLATVGVLWVRAVASRTITWIGKCHQSLSAKW